MLCDLLSSVKHIRRRLAECLGLKMNYKARYLCMLQSINLLFCRMSYTPKVVALNVAHTAKINKEFLSIFIKDVVYSFSSK